MEDLKNRLATAVALSPTAALKTTQTGPTIDLAGYEGCLFVIELGPTGDTLSGALNYEFDLEESPDGSAWSQASWVQYNPTGSANAGAIGFVNASDAAAQTITGGYLGIARYVRLSVVVTGTMTNGTPAAAIAVLGFARHKPAGQTQLP